MDTVICEDVEWCYLAWNDYSIVGVLSLEWHTNKIHFTSSLHCFPIICSIGLQDFCIKMALALELKVSLINDDSGAPSYGGSSKCLLFWLRQVPISSPINKHFRGFSASLLVDLDWRNRFSFTSYSSPWNIVLASIFTLWSIKKLKTMQIWATTGFECAPKK